VSPDRVEAIRRGYDAWNRGDLERVRALYAPEVTAHAGALWPTAGVVSGADAIIENFSSILATFERSELLAEDFIEIGEFVVVPTRWLGTLSGSDSVIEQRVIAAYKFRGDRVVRIEYFADLEEALRAIEGQR
jgi:ketosteroid isomerase-like protein